MLFGSNDETTIKRFLEKEEKHHANAISFYELFLLCKDRFILIENELCDLKKMLNNYFTIDNIIFKEDLESNITLMITLFDGKKEYIAMTSDYLDGVNIILDTTNGKYNKLLQHIKPMVIKAFKRENKLSISKTFNITSSSDAFSIKGLSNELELNLKIKDINNFFKLYYLFDMDKINNDKALKFFECKTNMYSIDEKLKELETLKKLLLNIKINESDVPRMLLKK